MIQNIDYGIGLRLIGLIMGSTQLAILRLFGKRPLRLSGGWLTLFRYKKCQSMAVRGTTAVLCLSLAGCISSSPQVSGLADVGQQQGQIAGETDVTDQSELLQTAENSPDTVVQDNVATPVVESLDPSRQQLLSTAEGVLVAVPIRNPNVGSNQLALAANDPQTDNPSQDTLNNQAILTANSDPAAADANNSTLANDSSPENQTTELALLNTPKPRARQQFDNEDGSGTRQAIVTTPSTRAARQQATRSLKRPSFLARLFKRPKADIGSTDDRKNPILRSSRTASRSNQISRTASPTLTVGTSVAANGSAIPGVRVGNNLFGIKSQNQAGVQVASVTSLARLSPKSLKTQHSGVNVDCINPKVIAIVNLVERRYGKKPVVTSGYRSPSRNRRAGGARNSMHIYCKAVDIQVQGVSKWNLAKYMRTIPGRGGVGTYCRTKSVHVDIGPKRDWHHSCRRKSKRRRRKS